ncbi:MAG TPA: hypothetical protein ENI23_10245 [bacterium]|nr:hypothetical protein [bacterium]
MGDYDINLGGEHRNKTVDPDAVSPNAPLLVGLHALHHVVRLMGDEELLTRRVARRAVESALEEDPEELMAGLQVGLKDNNPVTKLMVLEIIEGILGSKVVSSNFIGEIFETPLLEVLEEEHKYGYNKNRDYWVRAKIMVFEALAILDIRDADRLKRKATTAIFGSEEGKRERSPYIRASAVAALGAIYMQDEDVPQLVKDSTRDIHSEVVATGLHLLEDHLERKELWGFCLDLYGVIKFENRPKVLESLGRSDYADVSGLILDCLATGRGERKPIFKQIHELITEHGDAEIGHELLENWLDGQQEVRPPVGLYLELVRIADDEEIEDFTFEMIEARISREGEPENIIRGVLWAVSRLRAESGREFAREIFLETSSEFLEYIAALALAAVVDGETFTLVANWIEKNVYDNTIAITEGGIRWYRNKSHAEDVLMNLPPERVLPRFRRELRHLLFDEDYFDSDLLEFMGEIWTDDEIPMLMRGVRIYQSSWYNYKIIGALEKIGGDRAQEALEEILEDINDRENTRRAFEALARLRIKEEQLEGT